MMTDHENVVGVCGIISKLMCMGSLGWLECIIKHPLL